MSNNNNSIQPVKIGKFRRALRSIKRKLTPRRRNTRRSKKQQTYNLINNTNNVNNANYVRNLTNNEKRNANNKGIYPNNNSSAEKYINTKKFNLSKKLKKKLGVKEYKSRYQQLLNKNLGKRTRLNRVKRFIKRLSPRSREMKKHTQDEWDTTMGFTPNNDTNNQLYLMPQLNGTFTTRRKSQIPKSVLNKYGKFLENFKIKNSSNV